MDVFAHVLWTNALFHAKYHKQRRLRYLAAFFGVFPDLISFVPVFVFSFLGGMQFNQYTFLNNTNWTFIYARESYNYSHSLVIFALVLIVVHLVGNLYLKAKHGPVYRFWFFWPMLGWLLHILIDIPSHKGFYETPLFFPLSGYRFDHGLPWSDPYYMAINYGLLVIVYLLLFSYHKFKRYKKTKYTENA